MRALPIGFFDVLFDFARADTARIEREDDFAEVTNRSFALKRAPFGDHLRFKAGVAVVWRFDLNLAEIAAHRFAADTIARVPAVAPFGRLFGVANVLFHFQFQEGLQGILDQALDDVFAVHGGGAASGAQLVHQLFLEFLAVARRFGRECLQGIGLRSGHRWVSFLYSAVSGAARLVSAAWPAPHFRSFGRPPGSLRFQNAKLVSQ